LIYEELKQIQRKHGYLPPDELSELSHRIDVPLYRLHSVASFFPHFALTAPARADVRICTDMSCHLCGADQLKEGLILRFAGAAPGEVSFRDISCLGRCDGAPAIAVNDHIFSKVNTHKARELIRCVLEGEELPHEEMNQERPHLLSDPYGAEKFGVLRRLVHTQDWDGVLAMLKEADLRGLGGAGFSTEMKWQMVRRQPDPVKYVLCNADESEPGTIKDRFIMTHLPYLLIEGMIICGLIVGAKKGYIYIRHEYEEQEHILKEELRRCYRDGVLGENLLGSPLSFDLEVFVSPGGYICGEESALIEAMEGKRAEPRNKPPFPGQAGLWNKPTVLNNVETFMNVPVILGHGVDWYKSQGKGGAFGLKFVGVSGRVKNPGVFEVPMGTPSRDVILGLAGGPANGKAFKGWAPSGPSSGYLPASMVDVRLDFKSLGAPGVDSMLGSGAIVVCDEDTCMLDMALNSTRFFRNESCGKCVPCRVGSQKLTELLVGWTKGRGRKEDLGLLDELSEAMMLASICGLGQFAPYPIRSVVRNFREEVEAHILQHECPAGVCPMTEE
jgi:NADH:ubiquinone oxidoreductase subunit F (NADH-binding)/NADH:ubiquinone oxidoreductase subunit E